MLCESRISNPEVIEIHRTILRPEQNSLLLHSTVFDEYICKGEEAIRVCNESSLLEGIIVCLESQSCEVEICYNNS